MECSFLHTLAHKVHRILWLLSLPPWHGCSGDGQTLRHYMSLSLNTKACIRAFFPFFSVLYICKEMLQEFKHSVLYLFNLILQSWEQTNVFVLPFIFLFTDLFVWNHIQPFYMNFFHLIYGILFFPSPYSLLNNGRFYFHTVSCPDSIQFILISL